MLREQIGAKSAERERERSQLTEQIDALREQVGRQSADYQQVLVALTDQREKLVKMPEQGVWARLVR